MRVATYSRVSTSHHDQNPDIQRQELRKYADSRQWTVRNEIMDQISGGTDNRPGLNEIIALARSKEIDVILVTKLDRLARSLKHLVALLEELSELGVQLVSIKDNIDLTTATGRLMIHVIGAFAEFERSLVRERTIAGLEYAKTHKGKVLGRPKRIKNRDLIVHLSQQGLSVRAIAKLAGCSFASVSRELRSVSQKVAG